GISDGAGLRIVQLYDGIAAAALRDVLSGVRRVFTYNGSRFDLPFIRERLRLDVQAMAEHHDLMFACWRRGLYGGLKAVERALGLRRQMPDVDGLEAVRLWYRYKTRNDAAALARLLAYNREDVAQLEYIRRRLVGPAGSPQF
ncbi:MAG TPA: ribonuclease H-like domain-containing protein, partial [Dehalococcoidia bacterium]